jgi:FixJ family two-component response regulator
MAGASAPKTCRRAVPLSISRYRSNGDSRVTEESAVVHVIDDDASWRTSVQRLMSAAGYEVALYESAEAFLETANRDAPGCILLDLRMPGLTGLQLQQRLAEDRRPLPIVFLSGHGDVPNSVQAMKSGAADFLTKPVETEVLFRAVAQAVARDRDARAKRQARDASHALIDTLTPTELRVLASVVRGMLNKQVAAELGTTERTIKWHRHNIMQKLQLDSLAQLVSLAERLGLVGAHDRPRPLPESE